MRIEAKEGFTFKRIHDGFMMGEIIYLGIDYSTGEPREDKAEYYEEVKKEYMDEVLSLLKEMFGNIARIEE